MRNTYGVGKFPSVYVVSGQRGSMLPPKCPQVGRPERIYVGMMISPLPAGDVSKVLPLTIPLFDPNRVGQEFAQSDHRRQASFVAR